MPWTDTGLPFAGATPTSRHASHAGAEHAKDRALPQTVRLLALLKAHPDGLTDWEIAEHMQIERSTVNARRGPLVKAGVVEACGYRPGPAGVKNTCWRLT